ncbi:MAG: helix-turn-helix domain-containing protein [Eggerthellaceae bacterium]|nr:helix-turn-helix domain-containing protein [Eggerthellaceae bacterium]
MKYGLELRKEAVALFDAGFGEKAAARRLGLPVKTAEKWLYTYRALGKEALFVTTHKKYSHELKVAAARDVVENGMAKPDVMAKYGIASLTPLESWCRAYREGGPEALLPKPKGRRPKPEKPVYASREEELEARVRELELELEIQKRINALADGRKPR